MKLTSFLLIATLVAGTCAQAQTGESRREARHASPAEQACKADIQKLCQGKTGQQAEQCLKNNQANLSSECKSAMQTQQPQK